MRIFSAEDVASLAPQLTPETLMVMSARLFHNLSSNSDSSKTENGGVPDIQMPLQTSLQMTNHKMLVMPARVMGQKAMSAVKVVGATLSSAPPEAKLAGLPAMTLVFDEDTGTVKAVINAAQLTAIRSGAGSALATNIFASPQAKKLVIFGSGAQAEWHARLVAPLLSHLDTIAFVVRDPTSPKSRLFLQRLAKLISFGSESTVAIRLSASDAADEEVKDADVICTCTPSHTPLFDMAQLPSDKPVHINAIGSYAPHMAEFDLSQLLDPSQSSSGSPRLGSVIVDYLPSCRAEAGELIHATREGGNLEWKDIVEVGSLLGEQGVVHAAKVESCPRRTAGNVTLFKAVGVGAQDATIAELVVEVASKLGLGTEVPF